MEPGGGIRGLRRENLNREIGFVTTQRVPYSRITAAEGAARRNAGQRPRTVYAAERGSRATGSRPANAARARGGAPKSRGGGRQAPRRRDSRPLWMRVPAKLRLLLACLVLLAVLFGVVKLVRGQGEVGSTEDVFVDNVSINGVSLSGYTKAQGQALMEQLRERSLNTAYTLTYGGKSWTISPADLDADISFDEELERAWNLGHTGSRASRKQVIDSLKAIPAEFSSALTYDEKKLDAFIDRIEADVDKDPIDAEVTLTDERPVITRASENGLAVDRAQLKENLESLITTGEGDTNLPVKDVLPTVVSDGMEMKVIAKFSTDVSFRNISSRSNVRLALNYFNQLAVYPGYTVDFNEIVGPRTEAAGFKSAPEFAGNETVEGIGGGVCQASTTLYNAVVMAGMEIIERKNHSMLVSYVKPSQDAAVEYGSKNFIFRNDTEHTIYIYTNVTAETATVTIYGTRPEYHYQLESVVTHTEKTDRKRYELDMNGSYCYYTTETKLKTEGQGRCESEGWIVAYDWDTKQEVSRVQYSNDVYSPGVSVYWIGIHNADGSLATGT